MRIVSLAAAIAIALFGAGIMLLLPTGYHVERAALVPIGPEPLLQACADAERLGPLLAPGGLGPRDAAVDGVYTAPAAPGQDGTGVRLARLVPDPPHRVGGQLDLGTLGAGPVWCRIEPVGQESRIVLGFSAEIGADPLARLSVSRKRAQADARLEGALVRLRERLIAERTARETPGLLPDVLRAP